MALPKDRFTTHIPAIPIWFVLPSTHQLSTLC